MWELLRQLSLPESSHRWALGAWLCDLALTCLIIWRVPFTNIDWEAYMHEVDGVLHGVFDYSKLKGPTGPVAYPAGFIWIYGAFRWLNLSIGTVQVIFGAVYLATVALVFQIYREARVPGWLLLLCLASKRVHSVYCLRLFNDALAQPLLYLALLLFLRRRHLGSALAYSFAVTVKMQPLLCCPAVGLCMVLSGGWGHALRMIAAMLALQLLLAAPFLAADPKAYLSRAFGGPGDLQHVWSVNWRALPQAVFERRAFGLGLLLCHLACLAWFAHRRWIPKGWLDRRLWRWSASTTLDSRSVVCIWFACNFVGVVFMRTLHFQYLVWYFHTVPFLAWFAIQPDEHRGLAWALRCAAVAGLVLAVEVPYLKTARGVVRGPDGRSWETSGVPTAAGSVLLQVAHCLLLVLLACRRVHGDRMAAKDA
uniref:dolichyl-P-Man:Man5GlcNAc2-PP-dolichol alpha-1,3-mannosyltransferase n=1 Tax=Alexandrium catenella TaxID=2925 RepID=A0A7S1W7U4_ALECA